MRHLSASDANTQNTVSENNYILEDVQNVAMSKTLLLRQCLTSVNFLC